MEKKAKTVPSNVSALILHDITALSSAHSAIQSGRLREPIFLKWEIYEAVPVRTLIAPFRREWCNDRLGNWTHGHIANYVNNTNGLEATNKVIKDDVTKHQLMPKRPQLTYHPLNYRPYPYYGSKEGSLTP